jgi:hypothetical protein
MFDDIPFFEALNTGVITHIHTALIFQSCTHEKYTQMIIKKSPSSKTCEARDCSEDTASISTFSHA